MSGAVCQSCHGNDIAPRNPSDIVDMDGTQNSRLGPKRSFERDWKEIRLRLERKIAAAAAQAISARPGGGGGGSSGGDYIRKSRWPRTPPKAKGSRMYEVKLEDKLKGRGANPRTGVISPSNRTDSSHEDHVPRPRASQKWKVTGNQWITVDISQSPSLESSTSQDYKLTKAVSSAGSEVTDTSSEGWGDRFVVHMPSAKEPNPPSMSKEEVRLYQQRRGKLYGNGVKRHEMDASKPKPTSEHRDTPHPRKASGIPVLQKDTSPSSIQETKPTTSQTNSVRSNSSRDYYSPDEVGQTRNSPLSDGPKMNQKELYHKLRAECFMGCVGMDQVGARNPDEVLLFPNLDDDNEERRSPCPAPKSRNPGASLKQQSKLSALQATSRLPQASNSRPTYHTYKSTSSLPSTSRPAALQIPPVLTAAQPTTKIPKPAGGNRSPSGNPSCKDEEDIFMSASSIARVAPKPLTRSTVQPSRTRRTPDGSSRPHKGSALRHDVTTPENELFFANSAFESSPSSIPRSKTSQNSRFDSISPGFDEPVSQTRQDSTATSNGSTISVPSSDDSRKLSPNDIFKNIPGTAPPLHEIHSPADQRARNELHVKKQRAPKTPSVAELDGFQVPQQLPSPPLSPSPSPPAVPSKPRDYQAKRPSEKKNTHTIRMEIRTKAEKARLGAEEAKSASSRLTAARQHAEKLAEARAAYDRVKAQSASKGARLPMDELREQKLNTERINEARKAYKAAKAKEEMEKKPAGKTREPEAAKPKSTPASASTTATTSSSSSSDASRQKSSGEAKTARKPRRSGVNRRSPSQTENKHTPKEPARETKKEAAVSNSENPVPAPDFNISSGVMYISLINLYDFLHRRRVYSDVLFYSHKLPQMALHCFKMCKRLAEAYIEYKQTGALPKSCTDDLSQFSRDIGQALVNFAVLGLVFIVIGRAAGCVLLIASWIVWFCRPFGWFFGRLIGR
ncbi:uncharacterized protein TRUGW13939_07741 [Talaromyces rugulosus]|uniref:Uncharacterized protein n=1 Tax=Talaromyces rugulosus TaxID=121627 RepID=A0A7H8R394_TALRU|nr:uncharacterized protein TRUGW13939_07741 [Talaromyces rugulosus]QKX60596.1 hypothetical protein TRUGW13939_07741 [Talaromyces rugulosus]